MTTTADLEEILKKESDKPDEMCTEWATVSLAAAQRAMIEAYNRGVSDAAEELSNTLEVGWTLEHIKEDLNDLIING
jgi:hypothetical protein